MRYELPGSIVLRTENAAKPATQASKHLISIIRSLARVEATVDYGCGKLRYLDAMLETTDRLAVVDSEVQLSRLQMVGGLKTSVRSRVQTSNRISAYNTAEFSRQSGFDRGFCVNVLSAIPFVYARENALRLLHQSLRPDAQCLFVVQYRNSDFSRMATLPYAKIWEDGILLDSLRGHSFYALISPQNLVDLVERSGFTVSDMHLHDGSVYLWGKAERLAQSGDYAFDERNSFRPLAA